MSKIDDLVKNLCPEGVPYTPLGEIGEFIRGRRFVKDDILSSGVPAIHYGELYTKYSNVAYKTLSFISEELATKLRFAKKGDVILVSAGETIKDIGKSIAWLGEENVVIHDALYGYRSPLDSKFVSNFFNSSIFRIQLPKYINSSKISAISPANLSKIKIPVPPIEIQKEIVAILDKFTELEAELEAELRARKAQYEYYKTFLFSFSSIFVKKRYQDEIPSYKLGELLSNNRGGGTPSTGVLQYWDGDIPWASIGDINTPGKYLNTTRRSITKIGLENSSSSLVKSGDILVAVKISPGAMKIAGRDIAINQDIRALTLDKRIVASYLFYFFDTISIVGNGTIVKGITNATLENVLVPTPPLQVQNDMVSILDNFIELIESLEKEILSLKTQYEYYRNKLLTFKELDVA